MSVRQTMLLRCSHQGSFLLCIFNYLLLIRFTYFLTNFLTRKVHSLDWMLLFLYSYFFLLAIFYSFFSVQLVPVSMYVVLLYLKRIVNTIPPLSFSRPLWISVELLGFVLYFLVLFFFCSRGDMTWGILILCLAH